VYGGAEQLLYLFGYERPATGSPGDAGPAPLKEHVLPRNPTRCLLDGQVVMTLQQIHVGLRFHAGQSSVSDNATLVVGLPLCPSDSTIVLRARSSVVEQPVCNRWVAGSIPAVVQTFCLLLLFPHPNGDAPCMHDTQHRLGSSLRRCKHHSKGRWSM
jgi:hypothetical protein